MNKVNKMMLRAGLAALALGVAGSASAAQHLFKFNGVVANSFNQTGEFGLSGLNSLDGQTFTAEFLLTAPGGRVISTSDFVTVFGTDKVEFSEFVPVSATLRINERVLDNSTRLVVNGAYFFVGSLTQFNNNSENKDVLGLYSGNFAAHSGGSTLQIINAGLISSNLNLFRDLDYTRPISNQLASSDQGTGSFSYQVFNGQTQTSSHLVRGQLLTQSFSVSPFVAPPTGGVPEPASWALMLGGFALTGGALRGARRRGFVKPVLAQ
jgi:hypothetical protein